MESDQDGTKEHNATSPAPTPVEETMGPISVASVDPDPSISGNVDEKAVETHDSMVTVRLSEPPALTVNTNVGPNAAAPAKPQFGHEYKPSDAMAEAVQEEESGTEEDADADVDGTVAQQHEGDQSPDDVATPTSGSDDEVDWEELQKTENQQSKDQQSDNVSIAAISPFVDPKGC